MRRSPLPLILTLGLALLASACGFKPLYGEGSSAIGLRSVSLASIDGAPDVTRLLRDELGRTLPPSDMAATNYQLSLAVEDRRRAVATSRAAATTRFDYLLTARYRLVDTTSGEMVYENAIQARSSYGVVASQYASYVAREDAVRRTAVEMAGKIERDLALYFAGRPAAPRGVPVPDLIDQDRGLPGNLSDELNRETGEN